MHAEVYRMLQGSAAYRIGAICAYALHNRFPLQEYGLTGKTALVQAAQQSSLKDD